MESKPSVTEKRFESKGKRWCNMLLFDAKAATDVIHECQEDAIPLLGIEGFELGTQDSREIVYSDTADILDLSDLHRSFWDDSPIDVEQYVRCLEFVRDPKRQGLYFEFVFAN